MDGTERDAWSGNQRIKLIEITPKRARPPKRVSLESVNSQ